MAKGGMPQQGGFGGQQGFGGGFGGQQQGFGGGFGLPQQQGFGGFGGGFGMPQQQQGFGGYGGGFGGGYQPSRQRFSQMPQQQQGFGDTFARTMPPQQQGFGGGLGSFFGGQRFNMPQQGFGQSQLAAQNAALQTMGIPLSEGGMDAGMGAYNQASAERNMAERARFNAAQTQANPANLANAYQDMLRGMGGGQQQAATNATNLYNRIMSENANLDQMRQNIQPLSMAQQEAAEAAKQQQGTQSAGGQMDGSSAQQMTRPLPPQQEAPINQVQYAQMPGNPYAQQIRQEDPRMQAMRMMQRMRFGGGGGYNF